MSALSWKRKGEGSLIPGGRSHGEVALLSAYSEGVAQRTGAEEVSCKLFEEFILWVKVGLWGGLSVEYMGL